MYTTALNSTSRSLKLTELLVTDVIILVFDNKVINRLVSQSVPRQVLMFVNLRLKGCRLYIVDTKKGWNTPSCAKGNTELT